MPILVANYRKILPTASCVFLKRHAPRNISLILSGAQEPPRFADIRQVSHEIVSDFRVAVGSPRDYAEGVEGTRRWADDPQLWGYSQ